MKSYARGTRFWSRIVSAVLCAALLGTNMTEGSAAKASGSDQPPIAAQAETLDAGTSSAAGMKIVKAEIRAENVATQALSNGGTFTVDFAKQFTLHIEVESELNLPNKKVEITVPDGLTVVEFPPAERGGMVESVTPENADKLSENSSSYGGYHPNTGTITYALRNTAEKTSFNIILAPDTVLWNRKKEQTLGNALKVKVYTDSQTYEELSVTAKITGKYNEVATDNRAIQTGPRLSSVGVKNGVPTAANQPFALRQVWLNPDKDYIDMPQFFRILEITIALPYYEKDGKTVYAEFDHINYDLAGMSTRPNMMDPANHEGAADGFSFESEKNDNHTVTLTWKNLYLPYGQEYITPYFKWTSTCDVTTKDAIKWGSAAILCTEKEGYEGTEPKKYGAAVGGKIIWQDGSTWYPWNNSYAASKQFTAYASESMTVKGILDIKPIYNNYAADPDIIYYLGQFHVVNHGGAASADKTVEFTYTNTDEVGVTAQKIPATSKNAVEVWYRTTKDAKDAPDRKYTKTGLTSEGGFVTFTAEMADLEEGEYFTKIRANVGSYERDYVGYVASRSSDPTSGYATTFGKLLTNEPIKDTTTYTNFASMKMYNTASSGADAGVTTSYTLKVTSTKGEIPLGIEQAYGENSLKRLPFLSNPDTGESKTTATAGDTITFNGLLSSSGYPYSSNNIMTDPQIYIRLPEKITVSNLKLYQEVGRKADKVFLFDAVTETVENPEKKDIPESAYSFVKSAETGTGYNLYTITFTNSDDPVNVGWFTDGLGQYQIGISFDMEIAKEADAVTLDMRDCVRFKSASLLSTSNNGTLSQYQVKDTYDMDKDNDTTELISTFNVNAANTKLSVVAARLGLTFTFGARVADKGSAAEFEPSQYSNFEDDGQKVYLKDEDHVVDMLFTLKNDTGRVFSREDAQAFYYFIPVPKKGDLWDSHMQDAPFEFDMSLTRAPELQGASSGRNHILVTYATEIDSKAQEGEAAHYSNKANYKTESELLADCKTAEEKAEQWKKVKMVRISATSDVEKIPEDAELKVNLRLESRFENNANLVGSMVNFGPCGVSPYSVGATQNQGHNPLSRIQVEFQTGIIAGTIFIDKNFNGIFEEGTDTLYSGTVNVAANHANGNENCTDSTHEITATDGTFEFTGRRADTYHVVVANPGSTDANGTNPLKFSLPETGGKFAEETTADGTNTATASVVLDINIDKNDIQDARSLTIGLQQPHTVKFEAEHATLDKALTKVWHGEKMSEVPTVTAEDGWLATGEWTDGTTTYSGDNFNEATISSDTTFTAVVKQLFSLSYDLNGGTGAEAPPTSQHIAGEKVTPNYTGTEKLKKGDNTMFVGWSETQFTNPLPEDAASDDIQKIISADEHVMPARDVILYAVYAVNANGNENPDYNDDAVHVRYHGNNKDYSDIICIHHHVVGGTAVLSKTGKVSGRAVSHGDAANLAGTDIVQRDFKYGSNIFVGWSTTPILDEVIETQARYNELKDSIVQSVTMLGKPDASVSAEDASNTSLYADADGNTNVYAVWAADRNNNKTPDYEEERKLTYDANALQGGTVSNVPLDVVTGDNGKPIISGDTVTLVNAVPTHSDVNNQKVVFIGWTEKATNAIFSRADSAPARVTQLTFGNANKTVYAAWGYDEDGDTIADVLETYTLTYHLNGGSGSAPSQVSGIQKNTDIALTSETGFTRNANEVFVGWRVTQHAAALTAQENEDDVNQFLILPGTKKYRIVTSDVTLYAVWAVDANGDKIPDYRTTYTLSYDLNGGTAAAGVRYDEENVKPGEKITVKAAPTRSDHTFTGWFDGKTTYQPGEAVEILTGSLKLTAQWKKDPGSLTVQKTVAGDAGEKDKDFHFTVTLGNGGNVANINGVYGDMTFNAGMAAFTLRDGETKTAAALPADLAYTVKETEANQDGYTTFKTGDTGTIAANRTALAAFTNTRISTSLTVKKVWVLDDGGTAAASVKVTLLQNGNRYDEITLDAGNGWKNTWSKLDDRYDWSVAEETVPDGFTSEISHAGNIWTITNNDVPTSTQNPAAQVPLTGDDTKLNLWQVLLGISALGLIAALLVSKRKYSKNHGRK